MPQDAAPRKSSPIVHGVDVDAETRCVHYHSPLDVVAIRLRCCGEYYACKDCHDALAGHAIEQWPLESFGTSAILCGACGTELTIDAYLSCASRCPACGAEFNPRCSLHHHFYFHPERSAT